MSKINPVLEGREKHIGRVQKYFEYAGDGVIAPCDGTAEVYFTRHVVEGNGRWLAVGVKVQYKLQDGNNTYLRARKVWRFQNV